jgi:hypothetical protein
MAGGERCELRAESIVFNARGVPFARLHFALSGSIGGWTVRAPEVHHNNVTDGPELLFPQLEVRGTPEPCTVHYDADGGTGLDLFVPTQSADWNGRLFVTAHGGSSYGRAGTLPPFRGAFRPYGNLNKYVGTLIDKGYAVAHTLRSSNIAIDRGDLRVTFPDGSEGRGFHVGTHGGILVRWARLAQRLIGDRLGSAPDATYLYGFSSGAMQGRIINYVPAVNHDRDGRVFDGLLLDDCGGGVPRPVSAPQRAAFVPQIDVTHGLYDAPGGPPILTYKRENAHLLEGYGFGDLSRHYEIAGVSHFDAGYGPEDMGRGRDAVAQNIDLAPIVSALIDRLDAWVTAGTAPPASRTVKPPEVAAPLGVYYAYPAELGAARIGLQTTAFAPYDGRNLEPLDGLGRLVDMNGNGTRERRETLSCAWTRLGLIAPGEIVTHERYVDAVTAAAVRLAGDGLLDPAAIPHYTERARSAFAGDA